MCPLIHVHPFAIGRDQILSAIQTWERPRRAPSPPRRILPPVPEATKFMSTSKAATTAASAIFTRVSSTVKDAALEAVKKARPQWHLVDAKDQASSSPVRPPLIPTLHVSLGVRGASHFYVSRVRVPSRASSEIWRARSPPCVSHVISSPPGPLSPRALSISGRRATGKSNSLHHPWAPQAFLLPQCRLRGLRGGGQCPARDFDRPENEGQEVLLAHHAPRRLEEQDSRAVDREGPSGGDFAPRGSGHVAEEQAEEPRHKKTQGLSREVPYL